jgi:hypothetical protein
VGREEKAESQHGEMFGADNLNLKVVGFSMRWCSWIFFCSYLEKCLNIVTDKIKLSVAYVLLKEPFPGF